MNNTSTSNQLRTLAHFPPEVLDSIFGKVTSVNDLKQYSLVCHTWNDLVKRHLFKSMVLVSVEAMKWLAEETLGVRAHVRCLRVDVPAGQPRWTADKMVELLRTLIKLQSLSLHLNGGSPGALAEYREFEDLALPRLQHLGILSDDYDRNQKANQQILKSTSNITSLVVGTTSHRDWSDFLHVPGEAVPVELPKLTTLGFNGEHLPYSFMDNMIISGATLDRVTSLRLFACCSQPQSHAYEPPPPQALLERLRGNIRTLQVDTVGRDTLEVTLRDLQSVEEVTLAMCDWPYSSMPPSVAKVVVHSDEEDIAAWLSSLRQSDWRAYRYPSLLKSLELRNKHLEIHNVAPANFDFIWKEAQLQMDILVNGVVIRRRLEESADDFEEKKSRQLAATSTSTVRVYMN